MTPCTYCQGVRLVGWSGAGPILCPTCSVGQDAFTVITQAWREQRARVRELEAITVGTTEALYGDAYEKGFRAGAAAMREKAADACYELAADAKIRALPLPELESEVG